MRNFKYLALIAVLAFASIYTHAQVVVGVQIGPNYGLYNAPPVCGYGYYPYYPFACAPYGYWGPQWFAGGVFIGAGPWDHFYFRHPGYWNGYPRFRDNGFRGFHEGGRGFRRFDGDDRGFNGRDRGFRRLGEDRRFHGAERSFGGDGRSFHRGGGGGYRSGEGHSFGGGRFHPGR